MDCLKGMELLEDKSADMILTDLPYSMTNCRWDSPIPLNDYITINNKVYYLEDYLLYAYKKGIPYKKALTHFKENMKLGLWTHFNRVIKDNGAILLFAQTPFDKVLGNSNLKMLRYEWIWEKTLATGHYNAKRMPMKAHENILVFYKKPPTYNPQKTTGHKPVNAYIKRIDVQSNTELYQRATQEITGGGNTDRYPRSVQMFSSDKQKSNLHSTQKPLALIEFLINTYTNPGELVLDATIGSGTTGEAALLNRRRFIGFETDKEIYEAATDRINKVKQSIYAV